MKGFDEKMCPQCGAMKIKHWNELNGDQKFLIERMPKSAEFSPEERKRHRFCTVCWHEFTERQTDTA